MLTKIQEKNDKNNPFTINRKNTNLGKKLNKGGDGPVHWKC